MWLYAYVIGRNFSKFFDGGDSRKDIYFWHGNFLFFMRSNRFNLIRDDRDDSSILIRIQLIKYFFIIYKFERLSPIVFISVSHD